MPSAPDPSFEDDDPFLDFPGRPRNPIGWKGIARDPNATYGDNLTGYFAGSPLVGRRDSLADEHMGVLIAHARVASRARESFGSQSVVDGLEHAVCWLDNSALGEVAFQLGAGVGIAQSLWDQLKGFYMLPRTFILAGEYEIALEASHYHVPYGVVRSAVGGIDGLFGVSAFTLGAALPEEKKAYDEVQALTREIESMVQGGGGKAWAQLKKLAGKKWQQTEADWDNYQLLMNSGSPGQTYDAGVLFGRFVGELLTTVLLLISIAGAAIRVARLAVTGAHALVELAGLVVEAEGTEIGTAAKTLANASAQLQSARAAGNAETIADAEKSVAAAAKDLQQKAEAVQQTLERNAPNLVTESGRIREARARAQGSGGGDGAGETDSTSMPDPLAFRKDLKSHLVGPDGFTKSGQLNGTHNLNNAIALLDSRGAKYTLIPTGTSGISELKYSYTNPTSGKLVAGVKTVYDPAVISDERMLRDAQQAGETAWQQYQADPNQTSFDISAEGVNFRAYVNYDASGAAYIGNVHPIK